MDSNVAVELKSVSDEDGIYADSEEGCEFARITITSEQPEESTPAGKTSDSCPAWLVDVWRHYRKKPEFSLMMADWLSKYPDLVQLVKESKERGEIDAIPSRAELDQAERVPCFYDIIVKSDTLRVLESEAVQVHRQKTVNGHRIDMRSEWGLVLAKGDVPSLCMAAQMMLSDLAETDDLATRTKIRIKLTHLMGCYGAPIKAQDPNLYERMLAPGAAKGAEGKGRWE